MLISRREGDLYCIVKFCIPTIIIHHDYIHEWICTEIWIYLHLYNLYILGEEIKARKHSWFPNLTLTATTGDVPDNIILPVSISCWKMWERFNGRLLSHFLSTHIVREKLLIRIGCMFLGLDMKNWVRNFDWQTKKLIQVRSVEFTCSL